MFVPSESVYAELHDGFDDVVQKAYRARVVIVSPSLLMLAIQVMQQILKDARMREAADADPRRGRPPDGRCRPAARARAASCSSISARPNEDVRQILISAEKIRSARAHRSVEFDTAIPAIRRYAYRRSPLPARRIEAGE